MSNVVQFKKRSKKKDAEGRMLCSRGFHRWKIDKQRQFDVKQGRLVTLRRCERCGITRTSAD